MKKKKTKSLDRVIVVEPVEEEIILSQRLKFKLNTEEMRKDMRNKV